MIILFFDKLSADVFDAKYICILLDAISDRSQKSEYLTWKKKTRWDEIEVFGKNRIDCLDIAFTQMLRILYSMSDRKIVSSEKMFHVTSLKQCSHLVANDRELDKIFDIVCEYDFKSFKDTQWMNRLSKCVMFASVCFFDLFKIYLRWRRLNPIAIFFESSYHSGSCSLACVLRVRCSSKHTNCMKSKSACNENLHAIEICIQWKFACNRNLHTMKICIRWKSTCNKRIACNDFSNLFSWTDSTWMFC